ncbi:MAG: DMT family transporter [Novosphingobium sp.]
MTPPAQRPIFALVLRLIAMASLAMMLALVKLAASRGVELAELVFWRQAGPAVLIGGWLLAHGEVARLHSQRMGAHVRRAGFGLIGMFLNLGAVILLPLAEATILGFTAPLFAVILSVVLLKEGVGAFRWTAVGLGFLGVLVITGPSGGHITPLGLAVGIGGAFMVALIATQLRDLGRTERPLTIVFWFSALSALVMAPVMPFVAGWHGPATWAMIAGIGLFGLIGQITLTAALRFGNVSSVIVMDYSSLIWATLWGWLVWDRLPPAATWLGAPLIIVAGLLIVGREAMLARGKPLGPVAT